MTTYKAFAGTSSQYRGLHHWVVKQLGQPRACVECGTTTATRYEWANISGKYLKIVSDWCRLCVTCHRRRDRAGMCEKKLHELDEQNTYNRPDGRRECKACRLDNQRRWKVKTNYNERIRSARDS